MIQEINFVRMNCWNRTLAIPGFPAGVLMPGLTWGTPERQSEFVIGLFPFPVLWASFFCCVRFLQHYVYSINRTEAEAKCLDIGLGSILTSCVTSEKSFYFDFLDSKSKGLDKLIIGCLSTSPCLSLFWGKTVYSLSPCRLRLRWDSSRGKLVQCFFPSGKGSSISEYWEILGGQRSVNLRREDNVGSDPLTFTRWSRSCARRLDLPVLQAERDLRAGREFSSRPAAGSGRLL